MIRSVAALAASRSVRGERTQALMQADRARTRVTQSFGADKSVELGFALDDGRRTSLLSEEVQPNYAREMVQSVFPKHYPHSVHSGYSQYVTHQMMSAFLSSAGGVLSMQAMLSAIGVGSGAIPLAATLNWVLKDGLGQLGGILFASLVNNRFDSEPKRWRLTAATALEVSSFIEMLTPIFPLYFLPIAAVANIGKNISFLASSASRAAVHVSFAKTHNLADITAKAGAQNIVSSMAGTGLGIGLSYLLGGDLACDMAAFATLSASSLFFQYRSLNHVTVNTLNLPRLEHIFNHCLRVVPEGGALLGAVPAPAALRRVERSLATVPDDTLPALTIGDDFGKVFETEQEFERVLEVLGEERYLLNVTVVQNKGLEPRCDIGTVQVLLRGAASSADLLRALTHAHLARDLLRREGCGPSPWRLGVAQNTVRKQRMDILTQSYALLNMKCRDVPPAHGECASSALTRTVGDVMVDSLLHGDGEERWHVATGLLETRHARLTEIVHNRLSH